MAERPCPRVVGRSRRARAADVHAVARAMPHVTVQSGGAGNEVHQVGGRSFVFFRRPRPDAFDPDTGVRHDGVIVVWVPDESDKQALLDDRSNPFFATPHVDGHPSVLVRASWLGELSRTLLTEVVEDAWCSRASPRRVETWRATRAAASASR